MSDRNDDEEETQTICMFTDLLWRAEVAGSGVKVMQKNGIT